MENPYQSNANTPASTNPYGAVLTTSRPETAQASTPLASRINKRHLVLSLVALLSISASIAGFIWMRNMAHSSFTPETVKMSCSMKEGTSDLNCTLISEEGERTPVDWHQFATKDFIEKRVPSGVGYEFEINLKEGRTTWATRRLSLPGWEVLGDKNETPTQRRKKATAMLGNGKLEAFLTQFAPDKPKKFSNALGFDVTTPLNVAEIKSLFASKHFAARANKGYGLQVEVFLITGDDYNVQYPGGILLLEKAPPEEVAKFVAEVEKAQQWVITNNTGRSSSQIYKGMRMALEKLDPDQPWQFDIITDARENSGMVKEGDYQAMFAQDQWGKRATDLAPEISQIPDLRNVNFTLIRPKVNVAGISECLAFTADVLRNKKASSVTIVN